MQARELDQTLWRDLEAVVHEECAGELPLVPRRFEVAFGSERAAPELQRGLDLGDGITLSGKIDRIDVDPFSARGIVQDYKSGKHAHSAAEIEKELRLQIPLYMLVLRDLVGIEPLGGVYRPLAGERKARGLLREAEGETLPGYVRDRLPRRGGVLGARSTTRRRRRARLAGRIRARRRRARPARRRVPGLVRPVADLPDGARVNELNAQQLAAVEATGEVFVSAGAGTGKTAVLVERFARAVCDQRPRRRLDPRHHVHAPRGRRAAHAHPRGARRAAAGHDLARELDGAWISTIHGFCLRLLKAYPFAAGLDPRFRELDDAQAAVLRSEAFQKALAEFCAGGEPDRLACSRRTAPNGLRRMLTGVYETLRSAGRELELGVGERPDLAERVEELREAAQRARPTRRRAPAARAARARLAARPAARPLRLPAQRRPRRRVRGGAARGRAGRARRGGVARPRPPAGAARALRRRVRGREGARVGARLRGPPAPRARPAARPRRDPRARGAALPVDHGRRVPGHEPAAVRAHRPARGRRGGALLRRRRVPVDLRLPPRRRRACSASGASGRAQLLPLTLNYRSRPGGARGRQRAVRLALRRRVPAARTRPPSSPTRCSATRSSCSSPTRPPTTTPACTGGARRRARSRGACASSSTRAPPRPGRSSCSSPPARTRSCTSRSSGARGCRRTARPARATSASSRSSTCSRTSGCCRTATTTARS